MNEQKIFDDYSPKGPETKQDPWKMLLELHKKVKDAIHKSIWITKTETRIIDTEQFQRLRHIRQTGPAYLLYPTSQHTRFDHSLGTLHVAQLMIDSIRQNEPTALNSRDTFLTRLDALLHDLVHLPYGHTLEDEGRLFYKKQWQSEIRQRIFFEPIANIIKEEIIRAFEKCDREDEGSLEADKALEQIKQTLIAEEDGNVDQLDAPYIADIVGNTICADILDYVKRDLFFCALSGGYDELIFFYLTLQDFPTEQGEMKKRLVIRLFKKEKKQAEIRPDVLTGLVDLLRTRYSIGERVYYHHTKREASAMIIKMVAAAMQAGIIDEEGLCDHGDDSLVYYIRKYKNDKLQESQRKHLQIAQKLEECFRRRDLYKPVYKLSIVTHENSPKVKELINDWKKRYETEEKFCELLALNPGEVLIYVPSEHMGAKQAKALVQLPFPYDGASDICTLDKLSGKKVQDSNLQDVIDILRAELDALENKHRVLWKLSVFVHPRLRNTDKANELHNLCQQWFENTTPYMLIHILAGKNSIQLAPNEISSVGETAIQTVHASDTANEAMFSRYCNTIENLLSLNKGSV